MKRTWIGALVLAAAGVGAWATVPGAATATRAVTPAPLPEQETYAAMLAGLAALTLLGRRRARPERHARH